MWSDSVKYFDPSEHTTTTTSPPPTPPLTPPPFSISLLHSWKLQLKGLSIATPCAYIEEYCSRMHSFLTTFLPLCPCSVFHPASTQRSTNNAIRNPTCATTGGKLNSNTFAWQISSVFSVLDRRGFGFGSRWSNTRTTFLSTSLYGVLDLTRQKQLEFNPIFYPWDTFCLISKGQFYRHSYERLFLPP